MQRQGGTLFPREAAHRQRIRGEGAQMARKRPVRAGTAPSVRRIRGHSAHHLGLAMRGARRSIEARERAGLAADWSEIDGCRSRDRLRPFWSPSHTRAAASSAAAVCAASTLTSFLLCATCCPSTTSSSQRTSMRRGKAKGNKVGREERRGKIRREIYSEEE